MSSTCIIGIKLLFLIVHLFTSVQGFRIHQLQPIELEQPLTGGSNCGYNSCPALSYGDGKRPGYNKEMGGEVLNVHLIPHSHDDTGWLKTVDQYYRGSNRARFGTNEENQRVGVKYILDTVVKELLFDSQKKYVLIVN